MAGMLSTARRGFPSLTSATAVGVSSDFVVVAGDDAFVGAALSDKETDGETEGNAACVGSVGDPLHAINMPVVMTKAAARSAWPTINPSYEFLVWGC